MKRILFIALSLLLVLTTCASAFAEAGQLILPAGTKIIGDEAFLGSAASSVVIPDGATSIGSRAFADNDNLTDVTIPSSVTSIADDAFGGSKDFELIAEEGSYAAQWWDEYVNGPVASPVEDFDYEIVDGEVTITNFYGNSGYDAVVPAEIEGYPVTAIGSHAFSGEEPAVESVVLPEGIKHIENYAFECAWWLHSVSLPSTLETIGKGAFAECGRLTKIVLPDGLVSIGAGAFEYCGCLTEINIPSTVTELVNTFAYCCTSLSAINVDADNPAYASVDGVLFTKDMTTLLAYPTGNSRDSYAVPDGVTAIAERAFAEADNLLRVTLPEGMTAIGEYAFEYCICLNELYIPASVTEFGEFAMSDCYNMTIYGVSGSAAQTYAEEKEIPFSAEAMPETYVTPADQFEYTIADGEVTITYYLGSHPIVVIPETIEGSPVTTIESLWCDNYIYRLVIPASVTYFDHSSFDAYALRYIEVDEGNTAYASVNNALLTKDMSTLLMYAKRNPAKSFAIPEGVARIADEAFNGASRLLTISIPDTVTEIGNSAFVDCYMLTEITIPGSVTSIGTEVFFYCESLKSVVLEEEAFCGDHSLRHIVMPENISSVGARAFADCGSLWTVQLPRSLTDISTDCLEGSAQAVLLVCAGSFAEGIAIENGWQYIAN